MEKEKVRTEAFVQFIRGKEHMVEDAVCLLDQTADKLRFLTEAFLYRDEGGDPNDIACNGAGYILQDLESDIRLVSADIMREVDEKRKKVPDKKKPIGKEG